MQSDPDVVVDSAYGHPDGDAASGMPAVAGSASAFRLRMRRAPIGLHDTTLTGDRSRHNTGHRSHCKPCRLTLKTHVAPRARLSLKPNWCGEADAVLRSQIEETVVEVRRMAAIVELEAGRREHKGHIV